jgi:phosphoketolase
MAGSTEPTASAPTQPEGHTEHGPLAPGELRLIDAYWRAANYLAVAQICT